MRKRESGVSRLDGSSFELSRGQLKYKREACITFALLEISLKFNSRLSKLEPNIMADNFSFRLRLIFSSAVVRIETSSPEWSVYIYIKENLYSTKYAIIAV